MVKKFSMNHQSKSYAQAFEDDLTEQEHQQHQSTRKKEGHHAGKLVNSEEYWQLFKAKLIENR